MRPDAVVFPELSEDVQVTTDGNGNWDGESRREPSFTTFSEREVIQLGEDSSDQEEGLRSALQGSWGLCGRKEGD